MTCLAAGDRRDPEGCAPRPEARRRALQRLCVSVACISCVCQLCVCVSCVGQRCASAVCVSCVCQLCVSAVCVSCVRQLCVCQLCVSPTCTTIYMAEFLNMNDMCINTNAHDCMTMSHLRMGALVYRCLQNYAVVADGHRHRHRPGPVCRRGRSPWRIVGPSHHLLLRCWPHLHLAAL